jgi:hypothetical protein
MVLVAIDPPRKRNNGEPHPPGGLLSLGCEHISAGYGSCRVRTIFCWSWLQKLTHGASGAFAITLQLVA